MIFTGSLVNARATAEYILSLNPKDVCLAAMGDAGVYPAQEDELCALYIKSILLGNPLTDINERIKALKTNGGEKFFNPDTQDIFPKEDFALCTDLDRFNFVLKVAKDSEGFFSKKIDI